MERNVRAAYVNLVDRENNGMSIWTVILDCLMIVKREREKQPTCPKVGHHSSKKSWHGKPGILFCMFFFYSSIISKFSLMNMYYLYNQKIQVLGGFFF